MIVDFKLPDLGEGLTESEIVSWQVAVGDTVKLNQVIGEVETAKAVVELPSPYAGIVTAIAHEPGTVVEVGEVIISFDVAEPGGAPNTAGDGNGASSEPAPKRVPTLVGYGADPESSGRPARRARTLTIPALSLAPVVESAAQVQADRPRSTPPVRKLARDRELDLTQIRGTGARGLITREDVLAFAGDLAPVEGIAEPGSTSYLPASGNMAREVRTPIKGVRKFTAAAMVQSAFTAPHVTEFLSVDVTAGMEFLARLRTSREFADVKLTPLTLAAKAVCIGVARQPSLNSRWDETNQEIVTMNYVNLGIAAATPRGLIVPNIKDAQTLGLHGMAAALGDLAGTARSGKTPPTDLAGGTFSITNIGVFGIDAGTPILNPGEAGILALGAVRNMPWEYQGGIALRSVMTLSLSFDHRLVDGEQGSRFLADIGTMMADPAMALALG
ncbi:dihydrolipoamide acetyltransferase family protein [Arthrobacter sp. AQ5-05]|uniref:dihydrolipoamide acetyltransferase family protein n=1 Tax=Arthrobacter sp. AQ5-05 TaxID=2184581 RepID=UPI0012B645A1|nr:dihydrolipoamide acetyltransferase family protein [Arthrobacter sp. AQ5-05]